MFFKFLLQVSGLKLRINVYMYRIIYKRRKMNSEKPDHALEYALSLSLSPKRNPRNASKRRPKSQKKIKAPQTPCFLPSKHDPSTPKQAQSRKTRKPPNFGCNHKTFDRKPRNGIISPNSKGRKKNFEICNNGKWRGSGKCLRCDVCWRRIGWGGILPRVLWWCFVSLSSAWCRLACCGCGLRV